METAPKSLISTFSVPSKVLRPYEVVSQLVGILITCRGVVLLGELVVEVIEEEQEGKDDGDEGEVDSVGEAAL